MRENVTQGACPLAPALTTGALNHQASFLPSFPLQHLAELGEGGRVGVGGQLPPSRLETYSSLTSKAFIFLPPWVQCRHQLLTKPWTSAQFLASIKPAKVPKAGEIERSLESAPKALERGCTGELCQHFDKSSKESKSMVESDGGGGGRRSFLQQGSSESLSCKGPVACDGVKKWFGGATPPPHYPPRSFFTCPK